MVSTKLLTLIVLAICYATHVTYAIETTAYECNVCEEQLAKYRKFILQAIISFEDVCDSYHPDNSRDILHGYQPPKERGEIWAFFKLLMAQFNDVDFVNVVHDAVVDRCRTRYQRQEDKRDSMVLGKKQRFHSWGGKRASLPQQSSNIDLTNHLLDEKTSDKPYFI